MNWINKIIWKRVFMVFGLTLVLVFLIIMPWIVGCVELAKWLLTKI